MCPGATWSTEKMQECVWELLFYSNYKHLINKSRANHPQGLLQGLLLLRKYDVM